MNTDKYNVAVVNCPDYSPDRLITALQKVFHLIGDNSINISKSDTVLIKPNFIMANKVHTPAVTNPQLILALAALLRNHTAKIMIGDSPAWGDTQTCINAMNIADQLKKLDVRVVPFKTGRKIKVRDASVTIARHALEADKIINLPKLKAHQQLGATFAVKNMFGCVVGKEKALWHFKRGSNCLSFCEMLIGIYEHLAPALNIIDAVTAMQGPGPLNGTPKQIGAIIAARDPIACELACCKITGIDPSSLPIIKTAENIKFGCTNPDKINLIGDDIKQLCCCDFEKPNIIPLNFTLPRIIKSVCKQALILTKNFLKEIQKKLTLKKSAT